MKSPENSDERNCCHLGLQDCIKNLNESEENEKENSLYIVK